MAADENLIELIKRARKRLAVIAPGLNQSVARALAARMKDLDTLSLTVILDADAEVYRMGYGEVEALDIIREASASEHFDLREQPGVRIGVVISDDTTLVFAPVSRNVEAGSNTEDKPNAVFLEGTSTEKLAEASGVEYGETEIGVFGIEPERVAELQADLKRNPPRPFDLTRRLTVFTSEVQFVELRIVNAEFSKKKIRLPPQFQRFENEGLRQKVEARLSIPMDFNRPLEVSIASEGMTETLLVNERYIQKQRELIERTFLHEWKSRGKVILRRDKKEFIAEIARLKAIITAYQAGIQKEFSAAQDEFRKLLVEEFLDLWKQKPPEHLRMRKRTDEESCRSDIESAADELFSKVVLLKAPDAKIVYKDVSLDDLRDGLLMDSLRTLMEKAYVDQQTLERLFLSEEAVVAKDSRMVL